MERANSLPPAYTQVKVNTWVRNEAVELLCLGILATRKHDHLDLRSALKFPKGRVGVRQGKLLFLPLPSPLLPYSVCLPLLGGSNQMQSTEEEKSAVQQERVLASTDLGFRTMHLHCYPNSGKEKGCSQLSPTPQRASKGKWLTGYLFSALVKSIQNYRKGRDYIPAFYQ